MTRPKADEARDYRWRVAMQKRDWAKVMHQLATEIDYCNFKNAVHERPGQANKDSAYISIWSAMLRVQRLEDPLYRPSEQPCLGDAWRSELGTIPGPSTDKDDSQRK